MKIRFLCTLLAGTLAGGAAAWAHGLERPYGTSINGHGTAGSGPGGSPSFTLLALEATSSALERALAEGRRDCGLMIRVSTPPGGS